MSSIVRLLTESGGGGVLDMEAEAHGKNGPLGKSVFEVFQEKHPAKKPVDPNAFLECETLPPLEHVDITADHVEGVAKWLFESPGPSGTSP